MDKEWSEVLTSPEYQKLNETKRWEVKNQYFDNVITPEALKKHSDTELPAIRGTFFNTNYNKFDPTDIGLGFGEKLKRSWRTGQDIVGLGQIRGIQLFEGRTSPEMDQYIKNTKSKMARERVEPKNLFETFTLSAAQLLPLMIESTKRGIKTGAVTSTGFMAMTAIAGQAGPQALLPEEIVTVPASGILGFGIGMASGAAKFMMYVEGGLAYDELIDAGVEDNISKPIASAVGGVNAALEMAQVGLILKTIPGVKGLIAGKGLRVSSVAIAKNPLVRKLGLRIAAYLGFGLTETAQEEGQELTTIVGVELGKKINNELNKTNLPAATKAEIAERLVETAKGSAGLWLLGLPGTSVTVATDIVNRNKQVQADVAIIASEGIKEVEAAEKLAKKAPITEVKAAEEFTTELEGFEGEAKVEIPVANAVRELFDEGLVSSGFHKKLNRKWTLVFKGRVSAEVQKAARDAGLNVSFRIAPVGSDQVLTDIWASSIKELEFEKATAIFNKFAKNFNPEAVLQEYALPIEAAVEKPIEIAEIQNLAEQVPNIDDPAKINYWKKIGDKQIYIEGWCDECYAGTGLDEYDAQGKINYAEDLTSSILEKKAKEKGLELVSGEFIETPDKDFIHGVTIGVYRAIEKPAEVVKEPAIPEGILREEVTELSNEELVHIKQSLARVEEKDEVTSLSLERIQKEIDDRGIDETQYMEIEELAEKIGLEKPAVKPAKKPILPAEIIKETHTIDTKTYNPLAGIFRKKIPLGTTMGSKVAHAKYYTTLFRNSIKGILKIHKKVTDVFGRSATLARIIDTIKPKDISINVNDLDPQVIAHQKFVKKAPTGVLKGYTKTREELLSLLARKSGFSKEAFYTASAFRRQALTIPAKERVGILKELPELANTFFRKTIAEIKVIDSADKSGKFLFLQRNSVRGTGKNQGFFQADGFLKGVGLSPLAKPEVESGIRSHSEFLNKKAVKLSSVDAFKIIDSADKSDFLLIDPPYYQEVGYAMDWSPDQTIKLINALDEAHKRGAEFTYHDTYNDTLVKLWEDKGYKVFKIKVLSSFGLGAAAKDELFVISSTVAPSAKPTSFEERQVGVLTPDEGVWGAKPAAEVEKFIGKVEFGAQQRKLARALLKDAQAMTEESKALERDVLAQGGIRAYRMDVEIEEYRVIPRRLQRKGGLPLDEMADTLNTMGYNFEGDDDLRMTLATLKIAKDLKISDFMSEAKIMLEGELGNMLKVELSKVKPSKKLLSFVIEQSRIKEKLRREKQRAAKRRSVLVKSIKHRLKTTGLKWGYQDKIKALAEGLLVERLSKKQRQSLENFASFIKEQQDEGVEVYATAEQLKNLGKKDLWEMTEIELRDLDNTIKSTIHQGRLKNKLLRREEKRTIEEFASTIEKQVLGKKDIVKPKEVKLGKVEPDSVIEGAKNLPRELTRTERFLEHIAMGRDSAIYQQVWLPINDTFNDYTVNSQKKYQELGMFFETGRANSELIAKEIVPVEINSKVELAPNNYKMAYIYSLTAKGRQHLMEGNNLTAKDIRDIEKKLTDQDRKDIKMALDTMEKYYPEINKIHNRLYGVDLPRLPSYFHFFVSEIMAGQAEAETMSDMLKQPTYVQESMEKGFLKERKGGISPLVLDFWGNISRSINMFEKYKAMALAERDVRRLIKHEKIKNAIVEKTGDKYYKDLLSWFGDSIQEPKHESQGPIANIFKDLRLKAPVSLLYGNAMIPIRQTGSLALGLSEVGLQATPYLMEYAHHPTQIDKVIYSKDPVQQYRRVERDIAEMISRYKATHIKALAGKEGMFEWGIKPVLFFDKRTSNAIWWMAYKTSLAENSKKITDVDILEAKAIQDAQYVVRKTQPAWTKKDLPRLFRRQSEVSKMVTMFSNYPNQIYNYVSEDTFKAYKNRTITRAEMATHLWWSLGVGSFLYGFSRRWRFPSFKEMLIDIILYPLGLFPLLRDATSALEARLTGKYTAGFHFSTPPFIFFDAVYKMISARTLPTAVKYGIKAAAFRYGVPYTGPDRFYKGVRDMLKGETGDWRRLFVSEWALGKETPSTTRRRVTRGRSTRRRVTR